MLRSFFFFNDTATTEIYTLSLHDALPIWPRQTRSPAPTLPPRSMIHQTPRRALEWSALWYGLKPGGRIDVEEESPARGDRKSTRLNSSHANISYAVFCLKKKNITTYD